MTAVTEGRLDDRLALVLAQLGSTAPVTVELPTIDGEEDLVLRSALVTERDGEPLSEADAADVVTFFEQQNPSFQPLSAEVTPDGVLVTYPLAAP
ncbi:hypothetical protein [Litorihabitans aurantiacus]|uniref:Uncharacterized protein n=1 Tax=Litorihabitans aurantiacus TaxID=1930061 RepID=A0AA38CTS0_9MICO|nr:hypothetical protein [Litorihabitans aurantiacus]GMA32334.1 hypothetical protein GCM10025875_23260 [Litorihabitans aurantiacus]